LKEKSLKMNKYTNVKTRLLTILAFSPLMLLSGCALMASGVSEPSAADITKLLKDSFAEKGSAKLDRLDQSDLQLTCSKYATTEMPKDVKERLEKAADDAVKYPSDGKYLGDWKEGEKVAQSGRGLQFSDAANTPAGGNCYACHAIDAKELSHGNIGPSLAQYGKLRGNSEAIQKYTWARIWNSHVFNACNNMPRFGAAGILTEAQIKDVMALLLDPASPVNK
jgi:L-cysteine S-thiosulfotransferase